MRIFENAQFDFVGKQRFAAIISGTLVLTSLISLVTRGLEAGIDFKGGTEIIVRTDEALDAVDVRSDLTRALGSSPEVKEFGSPDVLLVRTVIGGDIDSVQTVVLASLNATYPEANARSEGRDSVSPRFADDLKRGALWAMLASFLVIFLYIMVRYEWTYSLGAIAALIHDVLLTLGTFSLLHGVLPFSLQIDQTVIAALLTIIGYGLNDTVVIFDRIREYVNLFKTERFAPLVNRAINSTLSRTLITSATVLIVVVVLFLFGGEVLKGFAFALIIGVVFSVYSTIFVASPVVMFLRARTGRPV